MYFFFDESGDFQLPPSADVHKAAVVTSVAISGKRYPSLHRDFAGFVRTLGASELKNGEPKGRLLTRRSLIRFCQLLSAERGVSVTPVTLDLSHIVGTSAAAMASHMKASIETRLPSFLYDSMREEMRLLSKQTGNLSDVAMRRLYSWANCFREAIQHAQFLTGDGHEASWNEPRFVIDAVQVQQDSRERLVFEKMVLAWLAGWSATWPLIQISEFHTETHPFNQLYGLPNGFDIGKLIRGNIEWKESAEEWALQVADIAASIVYRAVHDLNNHNDTVGIFRQLMRSSIYGPARGPGLFSPLQEEKHLPAPKYALLSTVMRTPRPGYSLTRDGSLFLPD